MLAPGRPDQAQPRRKIVAVAGEHGLLRLNERPERVRALHIEAPAQRRRILVPHSHVHLQALRDVPVVLHVKSRIERAQTLAAAEREANRRRLIGNQVGDAVVRVTRRTSLVAHTAHLPQFEPRLDRMRPADHGEVIRDRVRSRQKVNVIGERSRNAARADRRGHIAVAQRAAVQVHTIEAKPQFVEGLRPQHQAVLQHHVVEPDREDRGHARLQVRRSVVLIVVAVPQRQPVRARDRIQPRQERVVAVGRLIVANVRTDVDARRRRERRRQQRQHIANRRLHRGKQCRRSHIARDLRLPLHPRTFPIDEEEEAVPLDRSAKVGAVLIPAQRCLAQCVLVRKEIVGIERVIAEKLE